MAWGRKDAVACRGAGDTLDELDLRSIRLVTHPQAQADPSGVGARKRWGAQGRAVGLEWGSSGGVGARDGKPRPGGHNFGVKSPHAVVFPRLILSKAVHPAIKARSRLN